MICLILFASVHCRASSIPDFENGFQQQRRQFNKLNWPSYLIPLEDTDNRNKAELQLIEELIKLRQR